jgi:hypothetical protein
VAVANIPAYAGATLLLEDEVKKLAEYMEMNDPKRLKTKAALKRLRQRQREDSGSVSIALWRQLNPQFAEAST